MDRLAQDNIPAGQASLVERHWKERVFLQIKTVFGYGTVDSARIPGM